MGGLSVHSRGLVCCAIQEATSRRAHTGSEDIQLLGIKSKLPSPHVQVQRESDLLQIRIRVEHTMGLLKGTFQSLKEIRIQLIDTRRHMIVVMWARVCIVLHNLIIRIEEDNFDAVWREGLIRNGLGRDPGSEDTDEEDEEDEVYRARRRLMTPGEKFRIKLMNDLFDSPFCSAERRT